MVYAMPSCLVLEQSSMLVNLTHSRSTGRESPIPTLESIRIGWSRGRGSTIYYIRPSIYHLQLGNVDPVNNANDSEPRFGVFPVNPEGSVQGPTTSKWNSIP